MNKLIGFSGGSVYLSVAVIAFAAIGLVIGIAKIISFITKNKDISKSKKNEIIICIISSILIACFIGGIIGYYFGILRVL